MFRPAFPAIVAALEYIIVDTGILDNHGRKLWKDYFLKKDKVSWTEFLRIFMNIMPANDDPQTRIINIKCLYALLGMWVISLPTGGFKLNMPIHYSGEGPRW